jgi:hypothetical protein
LYIAFTATGSVAFFVWPAVSYTFKMQSSRFVQSFSVGIALCTVFGWMYTGHWFMNDCLGVAICITMITVVRIPSLRLATLCLTGLFFYDVSSTYISVNRLGLAHPCRLVLLCRFFGYFIPNKSSART